jgi:4'-phosphopantetheinyl transferase EntD
VPTPGRVLRAIALPREAGAVAARSARRPEVCWDRLLFSAKKSVFRTWYPLMRRELEFGQAEIALDPDTGSFTARLLVPGPTADGRRFDTFTGRWIVRDRFLMTAITLPSPTAPSAG